MSEILNRMAKRALGSLPGIQPVSPPQFAQPGGSASPLELETHVEADAPRPSARRAASSRQIAPVSKRFVVPASSAPLPAHLSPGDRKQTARDPLPENLAPENLAPADGEAPVAPPRALEAAASSQYRDSSAESAEAPGHGAARPEGHQEPPVELAEVHRTEPVEHPPQPESRGDASTLALPPRRQPLPQPAPQPLRPAEQKTEIHISIGSIELRAPRGEARPAAPPFRPRVTLDQFLRGKGEARS